MNIIKHTLAMVSTGLVITLLFSSCRTSVPSPSNNQVEPLGTDYIFREDTGFYAYAPSIVQADSTTRYVYYTTNIEKENNLSDVIAVRKGTLNDGKYVYGDRKIVLTPTENQWDSQRVTCPSVINGDFSYQGENYTVLMAYTANSIEASKNFQIGLAVAKNPEGPFIKVGNTPIIVYNPDISGSQYGAGNPSLVSFDKKGTVRLFYSHGDNNLSSTRVVDADFTNLDTPKLSGYLTVSYLGLPDDGLGFPLVANGDFALSADGASVYMVKDGFPYATNEPKVASKLTLAKMETKGLYDPNGTWDTVASEINQIDTFVDEEHLGWPRMYSACILRDSYGYLADSSTMSLCFTSSREASGLEDKSYLFSPGLHMYEVSQ